MRSFAPGTAEYEMADDAMTPAVSAVVFTKARREMAGVFMVGNVSGLFCMSWDSPLFRRHEMMARANTHQHAAFPLPSMGRGIEGER